MPLWGVGITDGNDHVNGGRAAVGELHFGGVVAITLDEVKLKRDALGCGCFLNEGNDLAIGERAGVVQENARAAARAWPGSLQGGCQACRRRCHLQEQCRGRV